MRTKFFLITVILFFGFSTFSLFAQDSTEAGKKWDWEWDWEFDEFKEWIMFGKKMPTISVSYGLSDISHKNLVEEPGKTGVIELKLGHTTRKARKKSENIVKYNFRYLFLNINSTGLYGSALEQSELDTKSWKFGFARSTGYGYIFGNAAVIPFFTYSHDWTRINFKNEPFNDEDVTTIKRFDKTFRFGSGNEAGIRIIANSLISVEAGYERAVVFERHLFWKWAGSAIIEAASHSVLDVFIREILDSSPTAGPIVFLVLKSALGYGIYELRQEKMNWPFGSAPPISIDSFKFGVTFTF